MVNTKHSHVNSKRIVTAIDSFVCEILEDEKYRWGGGERTRTEVLDMFHEFMEEGVSQGKLQNFKIICDGRNNPDSDFRKGLYHLTIEFQQAHCLNRTVLNYDFGTYVQ